MDTSLIVNSSIEIAASAEKIWKALTDAEMIKQYLFNTTVTTDWQEGSSIVFTGEWQGNSFKDKGNVLRVKKFRQLEYNYWSGFSGMEDKSENYSIVTYTIEEVETGSMLSVSQKGFANEQSKNHAEEGWKTVLDKIKEITENPE
jgi:uncharacterized protein YndB with AHSA1/START domain